MARIARIKMGRIKILLFLLALNAVGMFPNITLNEGLYIGAFVVIALMFHKRRKVFLSALLIVLISLIFQINDFLIPEIKEVSQGYWRMNAVVNGINAFLFGWISWEWIRRLQPGAIKACFCDELGLAVIVTFLILSVYFLLRFLMTEFYPRELLFVFQIFEASILFFIFRDVFELYPTKEV